MSKTIVFCADGTWNGAEEKTDGNAPGGATGLQPGLTNVCKTFAWLDGVIQPNGAWGGVEMEKVLADANGAPVQIAKYLHGVGDSKRLPDRIVGGAFGVGVVARIARGYTYISREYQAGDRIVIIGFSRGAYTARALAGLIAGQGLLRPELARADDDDRYDTAAAAWFRWRHSHGTTLQKIVDGVTQFAQLHTAFPNPKQLDDDSFVPVEIAAVAVWDTVGALGIPIYAVGAVVDLFQFANTELSPKVGVGIHAVSLDEERVPFSPTLWDVNDPRVVQTLFAGGHCDVGGGYDEHGLSDGPLLWVVDELRKVGVKFKDEPPCAVEFDPLAPRHRAWEDDPAWKFAGVASRKFPAGIRIDPSVHLRMAQTPEVLFGAPANKVGYAPNNLPGSIVASTDATHASQMPINEPAADMRPVPAQPQPQPQQPNVR